MRKTTQHTYRAEITGGIWWPMGAKAATIATFTAKSDKEAMASVDTHAGDFSSVDDFRLERVSGWRVNSKSGAARRYVEEHKVVKDWSSEETEFQFSDCMYPAED